MEYYARPINETFLSLLSKEELQDYLNKLTFFDRMSEFQLENLASLLGFDPDSNNLTTGQHGHSETLKHSPNRVGTYHTPPFIDTIYFSEYEMYDEERIEMTLSEFNVTNLQVFSQPDPFSTDGSELLYTASSEELEEKTQILRNFLSDLFSDYNEKVKLHNKNQTTNQSTTTTKEMQ